MCFNDLPVPDIVAVTVIGSVRETCGSTVRRTWEPLFSCRFRDSEEFSGLLLRLHCITVIMTTKYIQVCIHKNRTTLYIFG